MITRGDDLAHGVFARLEPVVADLAVAVGLLFVPSVEGDRDPGHAGLAGIHDAVLVFVEELDDADLARVAFDARFRIFRRLQRLLDAFR